MLIDRRMAIIFAVVQSLSCDWLFVTPWTIAHQVPLSSTVSLSLLIFMSIELMMLSKPSHPVPPTFPFAFKFSQHQGLFS